MFGHAPQSPPVGDARSLTGVELANGIAELQQSLNMLEGSPIASMPWLRAVLLVSPQSSDDLALKLVNSGIFVLEAPEDEPVEQVVEEFKHQLQRVQDTFMHEPATSRSRTGHQDPSTPGGPTNQNQESPFSRTPAYFNPELYNEWLGKLAEPWRQENAWDSES